MNFPMTSTEHLTAPAWLGRASILLPLLFSIVGCGRVVGAECIDGYDNCNDTCCPEGMCSPNGVCLATDGGSILDGDVRDGDVLDGEVRDGDVLDGDVRDGDIVVPDMGPLGCDIGSSRCGTICVNLDFDVNNCGSCDAACEAGEFCSFGSCVGSCDPPLILCDGQCIDPGSNPDNCGVCGNECSSAICRPSGCADTEASDVILIGHDFEASPMAIDLLVGNSSLLRLEDPVRIVIYNGTVDEDNRVAVLEGIDSIATEASRSYQLVPSSATLVPTRLQRADTFLVMPQHGTTTDEQLRALGRMWAVAMDSFLKRGGAVVVLEGGENHSGTWQILQEANLLSVDGRIALEPGVILSNDVPTDAITNEVPLSYAAPADSFAFTGVEGGEVVNVTVDDMRLPVAIHRFVAPTDGD